MADAPAWLKAYETPVAAPPTPRELKTAAEMHSTEAGTALKGQQAQLTALRVQTEREKAAAREGALTDAANAETKAAAAQREAINRDLAAIAQAKALISGTTTGIGAVGAKLRLGTPAYQLEALLDQLRKSSSMAAFQEARAGSKTGGTGLRGTNTEFNAAGVARGNLTTGGGPEFLNQQLDNYALHLRRGAALSEGKDLNDPQVAKDYGFQLPQATRAPTDGVLPSGTLTGTQGVTTLANVPPGTEDLVRNMVVKGYSADQIRAEADKIEPGLGLRLRGIENWVDYYKRPTALGETRALPTVVPETRSEDKSGLAYYLGRAAESPFGTALIQAGNAALPGVLPFMSSDPERTRAVIASTAMRDPGSAALGDVAGTVLGSFGLGKLGAATKLGALTNPYVQAAIQGGAQGAAGSKESSAAGVLTDAAIQATENVAGAKVGSLAAKYIAPVVGGLGNKAADYLTARGVPLTFGDIVGERMESLPKFLQKYAQPARQQSIEAIHLSALNDALAPTRGVPGESLSVPGVDTSAITTPGSAGMKELSTRLSGGYNELLGDRTFGATAEDQEVINSVLRKLDNAGKGGKAAADSIRDMLPSVALPRGAAVAEGEAATKAAEAAAPEITGETAQAVYRTLPSLRNEARLNRPGRYATAIKPALDEFETKLGDILGREDPTLLGDLKRLNQAWGSKSVLEDAGRNALERGQTAAEQAGVPHPDDLVSAAINHADNYGWSEGADNFRFKDLAQAGQEALGPRQGPAMQPSLLGPVVASLGGGAIAAGLTTTEDAKGEKHYDPLTDISAAIASGLLAKGAGAVPYLPAARELTQRVLAGPRSEAAVNAADLLRRYLPAASAGVVDYSNYDPYPKRMNAPAYIPIPNITPRKPQGMLGVLLETAQPQQPDDSVSVEQQPGG